ncbi:TIGR04283 family arsenosugar biosynthesis glycosyltransferase [Dactylococcopsis salina]|uniref:4,4'-diaponeurosporenoate glycosyltransferase n=1 Tax=Dactylococcopsis salina (strain PCC 8305) TaxID=13035 RepID=K9YUL9_DACS8|nr:TIGR04283 family arsenosugar biosynthesis glycosyltransferase [Dactylococcopsis salina]AFZ50050.1 glycosyl transferase [Dactylococcopsis salina PCC 8305]
MEAIKLSVIIPVLNEEKTIAQTLEHLQKTAVEIIIVDGGSTDNTVEIVQNMGIKTILSPEPGRSNQMNTGAKYAIGKVLLFLHADTKLPHNYLQYIEESLEKPNTIAGAFLLKIESQNPLLRIVEKGVNARSRLLQMPYGDQGIFLKKETFETIGGFPDIPLMEDFQLMLTLKKQGKIRLAKAPVITSARRWEKLGVIKTTLINQKVILGYFLGVSPEKLKQWYQ